MYNEGCLNSSTFAAFSVNVEGGGGGRDHCPGPEDNYHHFVTPWSKTVGVTSRLQLWPHLICQPGCCKAVTTLSKPCDNLVVTSLIH